MLAERNATHAILIVRTHEISDDIEADIAEIVENVLRKNLSAAEEAVAIPNSLNSALRWRRSGQRWREVVLQK